MSSFRLDSTSPAKRPRAAMGRWLTSLVDDVAFGEFRDPILNRSSPLGTEKKLDQLVVANLAAGTQQLDQLVDKSRKLLARDIVVGPAEVAVAMEDLADSFFQDFASDATVALFVVQMLLPVVAGIAVRLPS
jgi:hypothetical protein